MKETLEQVDALIKKGEGTAARELLETVEKSDLAGDEKAAYAELSIRVGRPELGVRLLNPIVRGTGRKQTSATAPERIAYAACLIRIGAASEGIAILKKEDAGRHPLVLWYLYFGANAQWNHLEGISLLQRYLRKPELSVYQRRVAQANLASSLVSERRHMEATLLLDELIPWARQPGHDFLLAAVCDFMACNYLLQRRFEDAGRCLDMADALFSKSSTIDGFFNRKWRAILLLCRKPDDPASAKALQAIREEAKTRKHWETLRDCDRYEALVRRDYAIFLHVYYGTPFSSFRARILRDWSDRPDLGQGYELVLGGESSKADKLTFLVDKNAQKTLPGKVLKALCEDFYRPIRVTPLHHELYPEEFYNPLSSPHRVHEAVNRTRKWIESEKLPLEIVGEEGTYQLAATRPCRILIPLDDEAAKAEELSENFPDFASLMGDTAFSAKELAEKAKFSERTAQRWIEKAVKAGLLSKEGAAKATRYRAKLRDAA